MKSRRGAWRGLLALLAAVLPASTLAGPDEAGALLRRAVAEAPRLNFTGVFVYRSGAREETSRVAYAVQGGQVRERIEVLDGSPREVIRDGERVSCFLPDENLLVIESRSRRRSFPAVLPAAITELNEHYVVAAGNPGRIAGIDARAIRLEPRDAYRYAHEFWIDPASGMLLKAAVLGPQRETLESFTFTQLSLHSALGAEALAPRFDEAKVRVRRIDAVDVRPEDWGWQLRNLPPGFRKQHAMRRPAAQGGADGLHVMLTDGMAAVSVFIEPVAAAAREGAAAVGPVQVYRRGVEGFQVTVMGEVPALTVRRVADGIERRAR